MGLFKRLFGGEKSEEVLYTDEPTDDERASEDAHYEKLPREPYEDVASCAHVRLSGDEKYFLTAYDDFIDVWDTATGKPAFSLKLKERLDALFMPDGRHILAGCMDKRVYKLDFKDESEVGRTGKLSDYAESVCWLGGAGHFAVTSQAGEVAIYDANELELVRTLQRNDPDGALALEASSDGLRRLGRASLPTGDSWRSIRRWGISSSWTQPR